MKRRLQVDQEVFTRIAEQEEGKWPNQSTYHQAIAAKYNETGAGQKESISWGTAMNRCKEWGIDGGFPEKERKLRIPRAPKEANGEVVQPSTSKSDFKRRVLSYLENSAIEDQWLSSNEEGWNLLNECRAALGYARVQPVNWPKDENFSK